MKARTGVPGKPAVGLLGWGTGVLTRAGFGVMGWSNAKRTKTFTQGGDQNTIACRQRYTNPILGQLQDEAHFDGVSCRVAHSTSLPRGACAGKMGFIDCSRRFLAAWKILFRSDAAR